MLILADQLMSEYGGDIKQAVGGVDWSSGKRKRVYGMDVALAFRLWPVIHARYGVERDGPTTSQEIYINAANAKRAQLERDYRIV